MYSIAPLRPEEALFFEPLAPFEVRPVLYDMAALPRVHAVGAKLMGRVIGLGIAVRGWSAPGAFGGNAPDFKSARLLTLTVARSYRRMGVGRAMLDELESLLASQGVHTLACNYALPAGEGLSGLEGFFSANGWGAPELTMLQCRADHAILDSPLMKEQIALPPEYEIVDWTSVTADERARIKSEQEREPWFPVSLDPFHFEPDLEIINSLALRYRGDVVGWLITRRTSDTTMYYRCLFVRADLAKLGRGLALICEAIRRHHELIGDKPGFGEWSTPSSLPAMVRFIKRHLAPFGTTVTEQRVVRKPLAYPLDGLNDDGPPARRPVRRTVLLTEQECASVRDAVLAERARWTPRNDPVAFHTLGATARLDAFASARAYLRSARQTNPVLIEHFAWLYQRLCETLSDQLGAPAMLREDWALPAFHVITPAQGANLPLSPVHCDTEHRYVEPGVAYSERPVSFSLCITADANAGVRFWDLSYDQTVGLDTEETAKLLDAVSTKSYPHEPGHLMVYGGDGFHQASPLSDLAEGTTRITLDGQAVFWDGKWRVYG